MKSRLLIVAALIFLCGSCVVAPPYYSEPYYPHNYYYSHNYYPYYPTYYPYYYPGVGVNFGYYGHYRRH